MKKELKKMLYCAGILTCLVSTNGCSNKQQIETEKVISNNDLNDSESQVDNKCYSQHFDDTLEIQNLSSGTKYLSNESINYSIRNNFLNNYNLISNAEYDEKRVNDLYQCGVNFSLFNNEHIKQGLGEYIKHLEKICGRTLTEEEILKIINFYEEYDYDKYLSFSYGLNAVENNYGFNLRSDISGNEWLEEKVIYQDNSFMKKMEILYLDIENTDDSLSVTQNYNLNLEQNYNINLETSWNTTKNNLINGNNNCDEFNAELILDSRSDSISAEINEQQAIDILNKMYYALKNAYNYEEFISENETILSEIFGDKYYDFIEILQNNLKKTKSVI